MNGSSVVTFSSGEYQKEKRDKKIRKWAEPRFHLYHGTETGCQLIFKTGVMHCAGFNRHLRVI